jgi:hypothetical protein
MQSAGDRFIYHGAAAGQTLVLAAIGPTAGHPTLINPPSSGKNFIPLCLKMGFVSGTTTIGSVLIAETLLVPDAAATAGAVITAATLVAAKPAKRGFAVPPVSVMRWSPTTNAFLAAPTVISATNINLGAASPTGASTFIEEFDGGLVFAPGTAMSIVYSVTSSVSLWQITLYGLEVSV